MSDLEFSGGVDFSEALSSLGDFVQSAQEQLQSLGQNLDLSSAIEAASATLIDALDQPIPVSADASGIPAEVDAALADVQLELPLGADSSPAEQSVSDLVGRVDSEQASITVDADTTDAQGALDELAASADQVAASTSSAGQGTKGLADNTSFLAGVAGVATGELGGIDRIATGVGGSSAFAAGGVLALAGGVGVLISKGLDAQSSLQRFNFLVGNMRDEVLQVKVGTLNEDLDKLAIKLGTDDEALRDASASLFQFALNSGSGRREAATFTNQVDALAARAVALNPALGSVADVADSMATRLARGGRFAASYGLSLTAAEIEARALGNTHKETAADLTIFEKSQAAAQIAVERYGGTLGETVAKGAHNAAIEQRSLKEQLDNVLEAAGKPLVVPFLEAFRAAIPVVGELAPPLGRIALSILPALADVAQLAGPPLHVIAEALDAFPEPLLAGAAGAILLTAATGGLRERLFGVAAGEEAAAAGAVEMAGAQTAAAESSGALTLGTLSAGQAGLAAAVGIGAFYLTTKALHAIFDDHLAEQEAEDLDKLDQRTKALATTNKNDLLPTFHQLVRDSIDAKNAVNALHQITGQGTPVAVGSATVEGLVRFKQLAHDSYDQAALLVQQMRNAGEDTTLYDRVLQQLAPHQRENAAATQAANDQVTLLTGSYEDQIGVLDREVTALEALYDKGFAAIHAQEAQTDAVNTYILAAVAAAEAGGNNAKANDDLQRSLVRAEEASLRNAEAARQKAEADHQAEGAVAAHKAGVEAEIATLQGLTSTLDPGNPLRVFLEQYIARLLQTQGDFDATVRILGIDEALRQLGLVGDALESVKGGASPAIGVFPGGAAEGAYIPAHPGGTLLTVGEGGHDEVVFSPANIAGGIANLQRLGVLDQIRAQGATAQAPIFAAAAVGTPALGEGGDVFHIDRVVLEQASPNPVAETMRAARQLRHGASKVKL